MTSILGIDPGLDGAIACYDDDIHALVVHDMPTLTLRTGKQLKARHLDEARLVDLIRATAPDRAICERVHAMPGQGVSSMFKFGVCFGTIRGILASLAVPVTYCAPQEWQRVMRVPKGKDGARQRAQELFPRYSSLFARVRDHGRADAALLALAGGTRSV